MIGLESTGAPSPFDGVVDTSLAYAGDFIIDLNGDLGVDLDPVTGRTSLWTEQIENSPSGKNASQPTDADQPTYSRRNYNFCGHGTVNGSESSQYDMSIDGMATALAGNDVEWYMICAMRYSDIGAGGKKSIATMSYSSATTPITLLRSSGLDEYEFLVQASTLKSPEGGTVDTNPHIVEMWTTGTAATIVIDNTIVANAENADVESLALMNQANLFANNSSGVMKQWGSIELCRLAVATSIPITANRMKNVRKFSALYGIPIT